MNLMQGMQLGAEEIKKLAQLSPQVFGPVPPMQKPAPVYKPNPLTDQYDPLQMIAMRLRADPYMRGPFQHMDAFVSNAVAVVFIVKDDQPLVIQDDPALFPSDALITQLRLLIGTPK